MVYEMEHSSSVSLPSSSSSLPAEKGSIVFPHSPLSSYYSYYYYYYLLAT